MNYTKVFKPIFSSLRDNLVLFLPLQNMWNFLQCSIVIFFLLEYQVALASAVKLHWLHSRKAFHLDYFSKVKIYIQNYSFILSRIMS